MADSLKNTPLKKIESEIESARKKASDAVLAPYNLGKPKEKKDVTTKRLKFAIFWSIIPIIGTAFGYAFGAKCPSDLIIQKNKEAATAGAKQALAKAGEYQKGGAEVSHDLMAKLTREYAQKRYISESGKGLLKNTGTIVVGTFIVLTLALIPVNPIISAVMAGMIPIALSAAYVMDAWKNQKINARAEIAGNEAVEQYSRRNAIGVSIKKEADGKVSELSSKQQEKAPVKQESSVDKRARKVTNLDIPALQKTKNFTESLGEKVSALAGDKPAQRGVPG